MFVIFTVDVEGHVGPNPVDNLIYGKTLDGKLCGIDLLMDILDQYGIQGLFFVDIAEAWDYGEEKIAGVLKHIEKRGHDVGVHIHPDHMWDRKRLFLAEYSYEEQYEIIRKCTDFYEKTLGKRPIAFRAGKYGANRETLNILAELGYEADFSEFYGQRWCHIIPPIAKANVTKLENGLIEIPVTSYVSIDTGFYLRHDKLDCGQCFSEFKAVIDRLEENDTDIAVLFAHSFSLIDWRKTPEAPKFKMKLKSRLEQQLLYIQSRTDGKIALNLEEVIRIFNNKVAYKSMKSDELVTLKGLMPLFWFVGRSMNVIRQRLDIKCRERRLSKKWRTNRFGNKKI